MDSYKLTLEEHPAFIHARAEGARTPENARRLLREAFEGCLRARKTALLIEMRFSGPSLDPSSIFKVISAGTPDALKLRRIAYVDPGTPDPGRAAFAETVAANRGVNVQLFADVGSASRWLSEAEPP